MKVLVVEDELKIANLLRRGLLEAGYTVDLASDGGEALDKFELQPYDLVILDLLLPGIKGGGVAVCREIRQVNYEIPILMLTAMDSATSKINGLDAGADDYVVKPFHFEELLARIRALLRRGQKADPVILAFEDLRLNPATRTANRAGREITLTAKEFAMLEYFMRNPGRVINQSELLDHIWDYEYSGLSNVVETYIRYVRQKITLPGEMQLIQTIRGQGYILKASPHV